MHRGLPWGSGPSPNATSVKQGRRPLIVWEQLSDRLNLNIVWNVLELMETMGLNDPGRLPSSSRIKFSQEEHSEPRSDSRRRRLMWTRWGCLTGKHPEWQTWRTVELLMRRPYAYLQWAGNEIMLLWPWRLSLRNVTDFDSIRNFSSYISRVCQSLSIHLLRITYLDESSWLPNRSARFSLSMLPRVAISSAQTLTFWGGRWRFRSWRGGRNPPCPP